MYPIAVGLLPNAACINDIVPCMEGEGGGMEEEEEEEEEEEKDVEEEEEEELICFFLFN
jgi:ribosomal protein L12E/L44/L45/RPP1/RPP2